MSSQTFMDLVKKRPIPAAAAMAAVFLLVLLPTLDSFKLLGLDESTYAVIVKAAVEQGRWLPLWWDGQVFIDKPPWLLWLQAATLAWFGPSETVFRLPALVCSAGLLAYVFLLGHRLGGLAAALVATGLLLVQEHFLLYARLGQLDAPLCFCLAAFSWHLTAFSRGAKRHLVAAAFFAAAAVSVKSWFGFAAPLAATVALWRGLPAGFSRRRFLCWIWLPPLAAQALWVGLYQLVYPGTLRWMLGFDFFARMSGGAVVGRDPSKVFGALLFYGEIAWQGSRFALVPGLVGLAALAVRRREEVTAAWWTAFAVVWVAVLMLGMALSINYYLPLCVVWALAGAALWNKAVEFDFSKLRPALRRFSAAALLFYAGTALWAAGRYGARPPDPNAALVEAVRLHPAHRPGEPLAYMGPWADTEVIRWYSHWAARPVEKGAAPTQEAIMFRGLRGFEIRRPGLVKTR